jgi:hypothetical protein
MTSVSANPSGIADLLQTFSGTGTLPSTKVQTALQSASPGDIVQLSDQAVQLQQAGDLFAGSGSSTSTANSTINLLA